MDNRSNKNSRARRRPESIVRNQNSTDENRNTRTSGTGRADTSRSANRTPKDVRTVAHNAQNTSDGGAHRAIRSGRSITPARNTGLTPVDEKKLRREERRIIKAEERQIAADRREMKWQNDVVRVNGGPDKILAVLVVVLVIRVRVT